MMNVSQGLKWMFTGCLLIMVMIFSVSCAKVAPQEDAAFTVGTYSMPVNEFNEMYASLDVKEDTPEMKQKFLDNLIVQKMLLQEAQKEGLDKDKDFLKVVQTFWEQALLKGFVAKKMEDLKDSVSITDKEAELAYNQWLSTNPDEPKPFNEVKDTIKWQLLRTKQEQSFNNWLDQVKSKTPITVNKRAIGIE